MKDIEAGKLDPPSFMLVPVHHAPIEILGQESHHDESGKNTIVDDELRKSEEPKVPRLEYIESKVVRGLRGAETSSSSSSLPSDQRQASANPLFARLVGGMNEESLFTGRTFGEIQKCGLLASENQDEFPLEQPLVHAYKCPQHPNEPVHFFCLECEVACLCGCCCLDGHHLGHEVVTVKEAWNAIKDRRLRSEIQTRLEQLVEDSLRLEPAIHDIRKEKMATIHEAKKNVEKLLADYVETLQASVQSSMSAMRQQLELTNTDLDQHLQDVQESLDLLDDLSEEFRSNTVTHHHAKLCRFYYEFTRRTDPMALATLISREYPNQYEPVAPQIRSRLQFFAESAFTRLSAVDQAAELIREL